MSDKAAKTYAIASLGAFSAALGFVIMWVIGVHKGL